MDLETSVRLEIIVLNDALDDASMPVLYFRLDDPMRRESDSLPAWYTLRVK